MTGAAHRSVLKHGLALAAFALFTALLLGLVYQASVDRIEAQIQRARQEALNEVLPAAAHDNDIVNDSILLDPRDSRYQDMELLGLRGASPAYVARLDGEFSGVILPAIARDGYSGDIQILIGILADGSVSGVRVTSHRETPGLGDKIDTRFSDWILDFNGRSLNNPEPPRWTVRKEAGAFDQFAGATITPRAVIRAVHNALRFFAANRDRLAGE